jgi:hypothetical protein
MAPVPFTSKASEKGENHYDLLVIGGGSGGLGAARRAAQYGARVRSVSPHPSRHPLTYFSPLFQHLLVPILSSRHSTRLGFAAYPPLRPALHSYRLPRHRRPCPSFLDSLPSSSLLFSYPKPPFPSSCPPYPPFPRSPPSTTTLEGRDHRGDMAAGRNLR